MLIPDLLTLLNLIVRVIDQALPCLGNDPGVVIVSSMVDKEAEVVVSGFVRIGVEQLDAC